MLQQIGGSGGVGLNMMMMKDKVREEPQIAKSSSMIYNDNNNNINPSSINSNQAY